MVRAEALSEIADRATSKEQIEDKLCKACLKRAQAGYYDTYFGVPTKYVDDIVETLTQNGYTVSIVTSVSNIQTLFIQW